MIKQFLDYCISSVIELKTKVLMEIGFVSGAGLGAISDGSWIPSWLKFDFNASALPECLQFIFKPEFWDWLIKNSAEGFIHGAAGVLASLMIAATLRNIRKGYLKIKERIKARKDGNRPAAS